MADGFTFSLPPLTADQVVEGELSEPKAQGWHRAVLDNFNLVLSPANPTLYSPTDEDIPADAIPAEPKWEAFPARLSKMQLPNEQRWHRADTNRLEQDEYCEWSVRKDPTTGKILRVTFTCELPEYFRDHLAKDAPGADRFAEDEGPLVSLYRKYVDTRVVRPDLGLPNYRLDNMWNNSSTDGNIMHLRVSDNNLLAAVALVAAATVVRTEDDGTFVSDRDRLYDCAETNLGNRRRNSDPQIAERVNRAAREGKRITLADPVGLYIHELIDADIEFPGGLTLDDCWHIDRGDREHILRARFELPEEQPVEDVKIAGRGITFGAQIADRVMVRISALADRTKTHEPVIRECGADT